MKTIVRVFESASRIVLLSLVLGSRGLPEELDSVPDWGVPVGNLKLGLKAIPDGTRQGDPVILSACIGVLRGDVPAVQINYSRVVGGLYNIELQSEGSLEPIQLTSQGEEAERHDGFFEVRGVNIEAGQAHCTKIQLQNWWNLSMPGVYIGRIEHIQFDRVSGRGFSIRAPSFRFRILPK